MKPMKLGKDSSGGFQQHYWPAVCLILLVAVAVFVSACGGGQSGPVREIKLAPASQLPGEVAKAPPQVREAYQFALANPDVLSAFPCYCGCGAMGHQNNLQCYVQSVNPDGSIVFDNHAFA